VTTKGAAGIGADAVVMTILVAVVDPQIPESCATLLLPTDIADGVMDGAKKPDGKFNVIVPPIGTAVFAVKPIVTDTGVRCAMRSADWMLNDTAATCPSMRPDETASETAVSVDV
jgi:hypothetical protein